MLAMGVGASAGSPSDPFGTESLSGVVKGSKNAAATRVRHCLDQIPAHRLRHFSDRETGALVSTCESARLGQGLVAPTMWA
jgi:hypothetical protein